MTDRLRTDASQIQKHNAPNVAHTALNAAYTHHTLKQKRKHIHAKVYTPCDTRNAMGKDQTRSQTTQPIELWLHCSSIHSQQRAEAPNVVLQ